MVATHMLEDKAPETLFRMKEAVYFINQMLINYHEPEPFRFSLNGFIQASRSVTFIMQSELSKEQAFKAWYPEQQQKMRINPLLKTFIGARNTVVKQKSLEARSTATVGLFRGYRFKLGTQKDVCPYTDNGKLLELAQKTFTGLFIDKAHSAIGEQLGVQRAWCCQELGEQEAVSACETVLDHLGLMLIDLAKVMGCHFQWVPGVIQQRYLKRAQVLLESDIDPSLPKNWGWV